MVFCHLGFMDLKRDNMGAWDLWGNLRLRLHHLGRRWPRLQNIANFFSSFGWFDHINDLRLHYFDVIYLWLKCITLAQITCMYLC